MKYKGTGRVSVKFLHFRWLEKIMEDLTLRLSDVIMADRNSYKESPLFPKDCIEKYIATGVKVSRSHYEGLANRVDLKKDLGIVGKDVVLYVGRLHPVKYVDDLVEMNRIINDKYKNSILVIAGDGILKDEMKDKIEKYNLTDKVLFLGSKTQDELKDIFYTADVVVQPHGGQVLVEAALAGKPVVVYDFDWHREFVKDGLVGFVVPFRDVKALADKVLSLLTDRNLRKKMGDYARNFAFTDYSRDSSIENEREIYDRFVRI